MKKWKTTQGVIFVLPSDDDDDDTLVYANDDQDDQKHAREDPSGGGGYNFLPYYNSGWFSPVLPQKFNFLNTDTDIIHNPFKSTLSNLKIL